MSSVIFRAWVALLLVGCVSGCSEDATVVGDAQQSASSTVAASSTAASSSSSTTGAGGQGGAGGGSGGALMLPERLVLTGDASGTNMMENVTCTLGGEMNMLVADGDDITGFFSGEFLRRVEVGQQAFQFEPLVAGPALVDRIGAGAAELHLVGDQPTNAKPYWLALEVLQATEVAPFEFEGSWSCAPLEVDGMPPDYTTTVTGMFRLAPP